MLVALAHACTVSQGRASSGGGISSP
jgi:hypothetical protein